MYTENTRIKMHDQYPIQALSQVRNHFTGLQVVKATMGDYRGVAKKRTVPSEDTFEYRQLLNDKTSYRQAVFISRKGAPSSQELVTET